MEGLPDRSFFGGLSITVRDSLHNFTLVNALDIRLTVSAIGMVAFCTTRRSDVWSVRYVLIDDIARKPSTALHPPAIVIDYRALSHGELFGKHAGVGYSDSSDEDSDLDGLDVPLSISGNFRRMQCTLIHSNMAFIDELFQCMLPRWSFRQVSTNSYDYGNHPARSPTSRSRRVDFNTASTGYGSNYVSPRNRRSLVSPSMPEFHPYRPSSPPREYLDPYHSPPPQGDRGYGYGGGGGGGASFTYPVGGEIDFRQEPPPGPLDDWAASMLSRRRHDQQSASIEDHLSAIQHRRRERQRRLVSHMQDGGALSGLAVSTAGSPMGVAGSYGYAADGRDDMWMGPENTIEENYALCPHCNKHGSVYHQQECQLRPVDCSWCGQRMRFAEFPYHAAICRPTAIAPQPMPTQPQRRAKKVEDPKEEAPKAPAEPEEPTDGRRCRWCSKVRPKDHDENCGEREVGCKICHKVIKLKDKKSHRATCQLRDNPKKEVAPVIAKDDGNKSVKFDRPL